MKSKAEHRILASRISHDFLHLSDQVFILTNKDIARIDFLRDLLILLSNFSSCSFVGLRILEGNNYLQSEISGIKKPEFRFRVKSCMRGERSQYIPCSAKDTPIETACANVFTSRFHPGLCCFTAKGSFWTGEKGNLLAFPPKKGDKRHLPPTKNGNSYESYMLVPINTGEDRIGLLMMMSEKKNFFSEKDVTHYEDFVKILGIAISSQLSQAALRERVKELRCLYSLSELAAWPDTSLDSIFRRTIMAVPPGWQYPEITCARLVFEGKEFLTDNFKKTRWRQKAPIIVDGKKKGSLEVFYMKKKMDIDEGPFLKEERELLNALVVLLGSIVEHRQTEEARSKLASIVEFSDNAIISKNLDGMIISWNKGAERLFGYTEDAVLGKSITILIHPAYAGEIDEFLKAIKSGKSIDDKETLFVKKDGESIDVALSLSPINDGTGRLTGASTIAQDISDRKRAENALLQSEHALKERVKELTCLYSLAQLSKEPKISLDELLIGITKLLPPAWQYPEITSGAILLDDKYYESQGFRKGKHIQSSDIIIKGYNRGKIEVHYSEEMPELDEGPFLNEERNLIDTIAKQISVIIDRRETEQEKSQLKEQLRHADRLATIGQLAAGVAHELNEPLGNILGFAQLMKKTEELPDQASQDVKKIISASLFAREIIKKLMLFARQTPPRKTEVNLNNIVKEGIGFLKSRALKEGIKIIWKLSPQLPEITADPSQLIQVFVNLVVNAFQAMPKGGSLTIRTLRKANQVHLQIVDTGEGIDDDVKEKIFLPFFTTKDIGKGTGLGLSVAHGIINSHGGSIIVKSERGKGTCFDIQLPLKGPNSSKEG